MNEEQIALLFEGQDAGLSDLILSMQGKLQDFLTLAGSANFSQFQSAPQILDTVAISMNGAAAAATGYTAAATQAADATQAGTARLNDYSPAALDAAGKTRDHGKESQDASLKVGELGKEVASLANDALPGLSTAYNQVTNLMHTFSEAGDSEVRTLGLVGAGTISMGLAIAGISFASFDNGVESLHRLSLMSGMTTYEVAGMQTAMAAAGVDGGRFAQTIQIVSRNLEVMQQSLDAGKTPTSAFSVALNKLGVDALDSSGNVRSLGDLMPVIADRFKAMKDNADATGTTFNAAGLAVEIFGRTGALMVPVLEQGSAAMSTYSAQAAELGFGSEEQVKKLEAWKQTSAELHLELSALGAALGAEVAPAMTSVASAGTAALDFLNKLPTPVRDLIITVPLFVGGLALGASVLAAIAGAIGPVIAGLVALSVALVTTPAGLLLLSVVALTVGLGALIHQFHDSGDAAKAYADAVKAADKSTTDYIASLKQEGATHDQIRQAITDHYSTAQASIKAASLAMDEYLQKLAMAHGGSFNPSDLAKDVISGKISVDEAAHYVALSNALRDANAQGAAWTKTAADMDAADKSAAAAKAELSKQARANAESLGIVSVQAEALAAAHDKLDQLVQRGSKSLQDRTAIEGEFSQALAISMGLQGNRADIEAKLADGIKNGSEEVKAADKNLQEMLGIIDLLGPSEAQAAFAAQAHADAQRALDVALTAAGKSGGGTLEQLKLIDDAFRAGTLDADAYTQKLMDLFSKPTKEELQLRSQIDANKLSLSQWQQTLANSSPMDQHIADLTKKIDAGIHDGMATDQLTKLESERAANIAASLNPAVSVNIEKGQEQADKAVLVGQKLTDQQKVLVDQKQLTLDNAKAADTHALSMQDLQNHVDLLTGAIVTDAPKMDTALTTSGGYMDGFGAKVQGVLNKIGALAGAMGGIPGLAGGLPLLNGAPISVSAGAGEVNQQIQTWATAFAQATGLDPQKLAAMEIGLHNYENPGNAASNSIGAQGPFQLYQGLADQANAMGGGGAQSVGNSLNVLANTDDRVRRAYQAYVNAGGGSAGLAAAESIQEIPGAQAIADRGGVAGFDAANGVAQEVVAGGASGGGIFGGLDAAVTAGKTGSTGQLPLAAATTKASELPPTAAAANEDAASVTARIAGITDKVNALQSSLAVLNATPIAPAIAGQAATFQAAMGPIPGLYQNVIDLSNQYIADTKSGTASVAQLGQEHLNLTAAEQALGTALVEAGKDSKSLTDAQKVYAAEAASGFVLATQASTVASGTLKTNKADVTTASVAADQVQAASAQSSAQAALQIALQWHQRVVDDLQNNVSPAQLAADQAAAGSAQKNAAEWYAYWHGAETTFEADQTTLQAAQIKSVNDLGSAITTALKAQYAEELATIKQANTDELATMAATLKTKLEGIATSKKAFDDQNAADLLTARNTDAAIYQSLQDRMAKGFEAVKNGLAAQDEAVKTSIATQKSAQIAALDAATQAKVDAIQAQIDAPAIQANLEKEADLRTKITTDTGAKLVTDTDALNAMLLADHQKVLQEEIRDITTAAAAQKLVIEAAAAAKLKTEADAYKLHVQGATDANKLITQSAADAYKLQGQATTDYYADLKTKGDKSFADEVIRLNAADVIAKAAHATALASWVTYYAQLGSQSNLNAEARYLIESNNQAAIVALLNAHDPEWNTAGKNLGEQLILGLKAADIPGAVAKIFSDIGGKGSGVPGSAGATSFTPPPARGSVGGPTTNTYDFRGANFSGSDPAAVQAAVRAGVAEANDYLAGRGAFLAGVPGG